MNRLCPVKRIDSRMGGPYQSSLVLALLAGFLFPICSAAQSTTQAAGDPAYTYLSLAEVARTGYETNYDEVVSSYGGPMSRAPVISEKAHPELVWVRPDMGIGMIANPIAFATGLQPSRIPWRSVSRSLYRAYLPIVISCVQDGPIRYEQVAFTKLVDADAVKTGHEKQMVVVRISMTNTSFTETKHAASWAFVPAVVATTDGLPYFWSYKLYDVTGSLPAVPENQIESSDDVLREGTVLLGVHREGAGVKVIRYAGALRFDADLLPGQKKSFELRVSTNKKGFSESELTTVRKLDFQSALDARVTELESILAKGTRIEVPEDAVNNIYKAQILYNQTQMVQAADRDYSMPVQGSYGVWPWEQMKQLVALDEFGYHDDVRNALGYFLKLQGTGQTHADVASNEGVFPGTGKFEQSGWENDSDSTIYGFLAHKREKMDFPNWTNSTGSALIAFAEHYYYAKDRVWLKATAPAIVKACDWIVEERKRTMHRLPDGTKPLEYGLMPAGEADDRGRAKPTYNLFTDAYSYQGLQLAAAALNDIGNPDGARLLKEAALYREDILEVMRRTKRTAPGASPYPQRLNQPDDYTVYATGPLALVDTGLLDPKDAAFSNEEKYLESHTNLGVLGLMGAISGINPLLQGEQYMVTGEDPYHYGLTVRGEAAKAILVFYSTLAFGVDHDTLGPVERFDLYDRRYAPFFIDSSGGMRISAMIRRTVLFERDGNLTILPVAPRRWLEAGKQIDVKGVVTYSGTVDFKVVSHVDRGQILVDVHLHVARPDLLKTLTVRIPHPLHAPIRQVVVNGSHSGTFQAAEETISLSPKGSDYHIAIDY
jgi:hypothetical protein